MYEFDYEEKKREREKENLLGFESGPKTWR